MAALAGAVLMVLPASGQGLQDLQLFAPADTSTFGGGVRPKEGLFFNFDYMYWWVTSPEQEEVGFPGSREVFYGPLQGDMSIQTNTFSTGQLSQEKFQGERFEIGDRWRHHGWILGTLSFHTAGQDVVASDVNMVWDDPPFGPLNRSFLQGYFDLAPGSPFPPDVPPEDRVIIELDGDQIPVVVRDLPVVFNDVQVRNESELWGVELMYSYRTHPGNHGGFLEFYAGARYLEFNDLFSVRAQNDVVDPEEEDELIDWTNEPGATLADSNWNTDAENHIVGPQVAVRWFRTSDRWTLDTQGRFVAGLNRQNIYQTGVLGTRLEPGRLEVAEDISEITGRPLVMAPTSVSHSEHLDEFSPVIELRVNLQYRLTEAISVRGGWTGMWIDGVARGANLNVYRLPDMGLDLADNTQDVFFHGFNFGVQLNY